MQKMLGNIWVLAQNNPIVISTNGYVKTTNGECVMGRGIAAQVKERFPDFPLRLGSLIQNHGNHVFQVMYPGYNFLTFPVKPINGRNSGNNVVKHMAESFKIGNVVPGWAMKADLAIIKQSIEELVQVTKNWRQEDKIFCPLFGCGAGELSWIKEVEPLVKHLDDRFIFCSFTEKDFLQ